MAEVKTYKCDVCEKIHYEESWDRETRIIIEGWNEDEKYMNIYNHVCPECKEAIDKVIDSPSILEDMDKEIAGLHEVANEVIGDRNALEEYINRIRREFIEVIDGIPVLLQIPRYRGLHGCKKAMEECMDEIMELKESKQRWKAVSSGLFIGNIIYVILSLIF